MDARIFLDNLATIVDASDGVQRIRDLVLDLAVSGHLVEQDPSNAPAVALLAEASERREEMIKVGTISKPRYPEGVPVEEPPHGVPSTWRWVHLGDVGTIVGGGTPKSGEPRYWADGHDIPWLTPADMRSQESRLIFRGARDITTDGLVESSAQLLPTGTVLFSSRAPIGHVGIAAQPLATNQGFKSCVPYVGKTTEYLYLFLRQAAASVNAAATGTTFKEVSGKDVALIPVPVPPLAEQERIVAKVNELMGLCDELESRQERRHLTTARFRSSAFHELTEAETPDDLRRAWERVNTNWPALTDNPDSITDFRKTMVQLAVEGRLVPQEAGDAPAIGLLEACQQRKTQLLKSGVARARSDLEPVSNDELPYVIPDGWTVARLDQWCDIAGGLAKGRGLAGRFTTMLPYLRVANVKAGYLALDEVKAIEVPLDEVDRYSLQAGDVLLTEGGDWDKLGRSAIWTGEIDPCLHQNHVFRARPLGDGLRPEWVSLYTNSEVGRIYFQSKAKRTTNLASINMTELRSMPLPVPPAAEQLRILARLATFTNGLTELERSLLRRDEAQRSFARGVANAIANEGFSPLAASARVRKPRAGRSRQATNP